ncbi:hypothetical protein [Microbacterium sp.]|uniref:hypothetical protein n=1 Tax=Microbacterium sp. TaxID=51671 RepID=UPI0039E5D099
MGNAGDIVRPIIRALDDVPVNLRPIKDVIVKLKTKKTGDRTGVRDLDTFEGPSGNPPIVRSLNPQWLNDRLDRKDLPFWRRRMAEGDQFNYQNRHRYPQNEVTLGNGKRLDSYLPGDEIVSRKNTQLDSVRPETAKSYIDEILSKYAPGTPISGGGELRGTPILEVPVQNGPVPQAIIDHANGKEPRVLIRDVLGTMYN